jgi:hypothetical protein
LINNPNVCARILGRLEQAMQFTVREDLDLLAIKLRRAQTDFERARSRGDAERVWRSQMQMSAITSERDRLIRQLGAQMSGKAAQPER